MLHHKFPLLTEFFRLLTLDIHGDAFGINRDPGPMTPLTLFAGKVTMEGDLPAIHLNIRFPSSVTAEEIREALAAKGAEAGLEITGFKLVNKPYLLDRSWPVIDALRDIANAVTGTPRTPTPWAAAPMPTGCPTPWSSAWTAAASRPTSRRATAAPTAWTSWSRWTGWSGP